MSKHTPGPWTWNKHYRGLDGPGGAVILDYAPYEGMWVPDYKGDWVAANARLIAAAPELLEALRNMADAYWGTVEDLNQEKALIAARAAIAKAEGGK